MKIYLMTDMEGCAGILNFNDWVFPGGRYYDRGKRLLTLEVNAAAEGFFAGGADEILVVDGHGYGGIDPELLDERLSLMKGPPSPVFPFGLDSSFDAFACVGQHAKAGTPYSHMTHTDTLRVIDQTIQGISIGEYGQMALCARELGIPAIFAAGEEAFAREAEALTPGVVTVSVKRGLLPDGLDGLSEEEYAKSKLSAIHTAPVRARKLLAAGAEAALKKFREHPESFRYPELVPPFELRRKCRSHEGRPVPYTLVCRHPSSFIAMLNSPWQEE